MKEDARMAEKPTGCSLGLPDASGCESTRMDLFVKALQDLWSGLIAGQLRALDGWNYVLLAILVAVEGPIATLLGAAAASGGWLRPEWVFVSAATGNLISDTIWYYLGYLGKTGWLLRHWQRLGVRKPHIDRLEHEMQRHAHKVLILAKLTLSLAIPALISAGLARVPWRRWFPFVAAAEFVWTGSLVLIGYHVSLSLKRLEAGLQVLAVIGIAIFIASGIRYLKRYGSRIDSASGSSKSE